MLLLSLLPSKASHHRRDLHAARLGLLLVMILLVGPAKAQQGASDGTCPNESTPPDMLGPFYVEGSPSTTQIAPSDLLQDPTTRLSVSGRVLSLADQASENSSSTSSCAVGIPNVTVEVWYAGPPDAQGNYYQNDAFRGQMVTDECGRYSLVQVFPSQYPTRPILHDHFRLSAGDTELLVTQLYFLSDNLTSNASSGPAVSSDGYVAYEGAYPLQAQAVQRNADGSRTVQFDLYLDSVQAGTVAAQSTTTTTSNSDLCLALDGNGTAASSSGQTASNASEASSGDGSSLASTSGGFCARSALVGVVLRSLSAGIAAALLTRYW